MFGHKNWTFHHLFFLFSFLEQFSWLLSSSLAESPVILFFRKHIYSDIHPAQLSQPNTSFPVLTKTVQKPSDCIKNISFFDRSFRLIMVIFLQIIQIVFWCIGVIDRDFLSLLQRRKSWNFSEYFFYKNSNDKKRNSIRLANLEEEP